MNPIVSIAFLATVLFRCAGSDVVSPAQGTWTPDAALNETLARVSFRYRSGYGDDGNGVIRIALFDEQAQPRSSVYYEISLRAGLAPVDPVPCSALADTRARVCSVAMLFGPDGDAFPRWQPGRNYSVIVEAEKGLLRVWLDGRLWQWIDSEPFGIFWYRLSQNGMDGSFDRGDALTDANNDEREVDCVVAGNCKCKVGFQGRYCKSLCSPGSYGNDCSSSCGKCLGASCDPASGHCIGFICDPFTGACPLGCQPGFLPPLCTKELVRLRGAPHVETLNTSSLRVSANVKDVKGSGRPRAAQLQYRMEDPLGEDQWSSLPQRPLVEDEELVEIEMAGLQPGTAYRVRLLLLAAEGAGVKDGQWSPLAPETVATTSCSVSSNFQYKIYAFVARSEVRVGWMALGDAADRCHVRAWRLRMWPATQASVRGEGNWTGEDLIVTGTSKRLPAPPTHALLSMQALTDMAELPPSAPVAVVAQPPQIGEVQDLKQVSGASHQVTITWKPPSCCPTMPLSYTIEYKCIRLVRCPQNCPAQRLISKTLGPEEPLSYSLKDPTPDALYEVLVHAQLPHEMPGPASKLRVQTKTAAPGVAPDPNDIHVTNLGSTSLRLHWDFPRNCAFNNGRIERMHYSLRPALPGPRLPDEGPMTGEAGDSQTFSRLLPDTAYVATLYYVSNGASNPNLSTDLIINTLPEGAEQVRVHMTTRDRVGLRWKLPDGKQLTKLLVGVTATANASAIADPDAFVPSNELKPLSFERCKIWDNMICATITNLQPDTRYYIKVQPTYYVEGALNADSPYVYDTATVKAITREGSPSEPRELRWERSSSSSVTLRWRAPRLLNGVLRNFVVIVHNLRLCCGPNAVSVIDTQPDAQDFTHEVKELPPSSTFLVSVTAVTSTAGPAANVTAHTAPATDAGPLSAPRPALELVQRPGRCLRLRLPDAVVGDLPLGVTRRLFSFMVIDTKQQGRRTASRVPDSVRQGVQRETVLSALPPLFHALAEILEEPADGTVCAAMPEGISDEWQRQRPTLGLLLLLEYEGVYSATAWQSNPFTLLDCFSSPGSQPGQQDDGYSCF